MIEGFMERIIFKELLKWRESDTRKPLILKGVRQCGKTYLLKKFGKEQYDSVAYFNFEGNESLQTLFKQDLNVNRIIQELGILAGESIRPESTLIIFDEIQFCNEALTALKYFYENLPEYHMVCAGSLLGIALSKPLSFPVGKVEFLTLRPMSFYEFLLANDETNLCDYLKNAPENQKISQVFSDQLETYLRNYYITGGMPEVVRTWIKKKDVEEVEKIQQQILDSYALDFAKHASSKEFPKLTAIWNSIPEQLAKENSKFIFSQVKKGWRSKDLEDALEWLISAGLVHKVTKAEKPFLPLSAYADQTFFKLYMSDVGLMRKQAKLPAEAFFQQSPYYKEFKGALTENYVLTELVNRTESLPFFWKSKNKAEIDFLLQDKMDIIPIEVKSERNVRARSLSEYRKLYEPRISVVTSMNPLSGDKVKNIPLYLLWLLDKYI